MAALTTNDPLLSIGAVAKRTGLAVSAIRFYADEGLITATRNQAGHRRFPRSSLRRVSFIRTCQQLGYSLEVIRAKLELLPDARTPNEQDWERLATDFARDLDSRIERLQLLREKLAGCIGCGCLSLQRCALWNADDVAASFGAGPRWLLGDAP